MNRRKFLSYAALATVPVILPAPLKFIFDLGAYKFRSPQPEVVWYPPRAIVYGRYDVTMSEENNALLQKYYAKYNMIEDLIATNPAYTECELEEWGFRLLPRF